MLTDYFQPASPALDYAAALAGPLGARLVLLHVQPNSVTDPERLTGELAGLSTEAVSRAFAGLARGLSVPAVAEVGYGRVADAVAAAVRRHQPTMLVLDRAAPDELPDELTTTTALDILRAAPYPMLVVPPAYRQAGAPRRVLLAADGGPFSLGIHAGAMRQLLSALPAALTVLHVAGPDTPAAAMAGALESVRRAGLSVDLPPPIRTRSVRGAQPAAAILRVARPTAYDLLVLIARPRSFLGELFHHSVTAEVLQRSTVPVLVLMATPQA